MTHAVEPRVEGEGVQGRGRMLLFRIIQVLATVGAFTYLFMTVDWGGILGALLGVSSWALLATCSLYYCALFLGALRWKLLMRALGALHPVALMRLFRMYVIGLFYNTYVPGGVGGDVVRALATREAFGPSGATSALAVVFIERAMGLGGMFFVVATANLLFPLKGLPELSWIGGVGVLLSIGGFVGLAFARRIASYVPKPLSTLLSGLPTLKDLAPMPAAVSTAVSTHAISALAGYLLIAQVAPQVTVFEALTIVPLSLAMAYLPISIGGVGVVELALVKLLALVGVAEAPALAAALCLRACQWAVAAPGGLLALGGWTGEGRGSSTAGPRS